MRKLYNWALKFAAHPRAIKIMAAATFIEASVFIIPPYPLQIAISMQNTRRALWIALINTVSSVLGGFLGYAIGYWFWEASQGFFFKYLFSRSMYEMVSHIYQENTILALILASITPIPFKAMTVIGGATHVPLGTFFAGALIGRGIRFFAVGILFYFWGARVKLWIDKYLEKIVITITTAVVLFLLGYYLWS